MGNRNRRKGQRKKSQAAFVSDHFPPGSVVRIITTTHWLFEKAGVVMPSCLAALQAKDHVAAAARNIDIVVDFGQKLDGWVSGLFGVRKATTHNCLGALLAGTGYFLEEKDLEIVDVTDPSKTVFGNYYIGGQHGGAQA